MEKINYFELFVKAIVFALVILALKTFFNGIARADEFTADDLKKICTAQQNECGGHKYGSMECIDYLMNSVINDRKNRLEQSKRYTKEYKRSIGTDTDPIARYVKEHRVEAPVSVNHNENIVTPIYYGSSPVYHQTHYSGVIHGSKIGDWYTIEGTSY